MNGIRQFLAGPEGRRVSIALLVVALLALGHSLWSNLGDDPATAASRDRMYICAETGKFFRHKVKAGDVIPVESPHSGKRTGYPAELCYWTADGGTKSDPTPVLLNNYAGKTGPTFCPDCGRLVVGLNPPAVAIQDPRIFSFRHGNLKPFGAADTFKMNAGFFDGHVELLGDLQASDPGLWLPKGSSIDMTASQLHADALALYGPIYGTGAARLIFY